MWRHWLPIPLVGTIVLVMSVADHFRPQDFPREREWTVVGQTCAFTPARLEATRNDIVRITFVAADRPYSFVIDEYRIAKRATPGHPAQIQFAAFQVGTFHFYSDLADNGCSNMRGTLVVSDAPADDS
jgi:heme/copper-type cytochrome/quinol oxidase subunit 2